MVDSSATRPRRVGHKGAAHIEPGNTLASFDAALAHGVDMIELDVLSERVDGTGRLLVAHDYEDLRSRTPLTLEQALDHLAGEAFTGVELDLDVKLPGYELRVFDALREADLTSRTLLSCMYPASLARVRASEPALRLGWSVPRVRRDYTTHRLTAIPALAMLLGYSALLPRRARRAEGRARRCDHGPLAGRHAGARSGCGRRRRRTVCVDCGRGRAHRQADRAGGQWDHHQRPASVRYVSLQVPALNPRGSAPARLVWPAVVGLVAVLTMVVPRRHWKTTVPRSLNARLEAPRANWKLRPACRATSAEPTFCKPESPPWLRFTQRFAARSKYWTRKRMYMTSFGRPSPGIEPRMPIVLGWSFG